MDDTNHRFILDKALVRKCLSIVQRHRNRSVVLPWDNEVTDDGDDDAHVSTRTMMGAVCAGVARTPQGESELGSAEFDF